MSHPSQLFLLADHIKLSLLERQRAISLNLEPNTQDSEISRSLESLRDGLERLENDTNNTGTDTDTREQISLLRSHGSSEPSDATKVPNDPALGPDFAHATRGTNLQQPVPQHPVSKSVRFTDANDDGDDEYNSNRAALLQPYRDDPNTTREEGTARYLDTTNLDNQQIHAHHQQILSEQDAQLDSLGESIGRQHQLSIQIGDELEGQIALLDDVDEHVDRHQGRLNNARRRLDKIRRKAGDNWSMMTIIGLIIVLVILIVILK
ncbi:SNARE complex subunit (Syn8), putative [Talaromyces stipitatus ATCC 10500]|uniref:SNARE complex subunit (Syn8), putative n=1 Tax=Talaromyces stipitatus (strain ATCC 10500 / CBS 375.48 / QM 6759 / NRRL 1006) TaxID=441959 RepID=B8MQ54_TALSN|nr:SNARE complex subunit (Syn8), putative [Talaromyces stipitatus ATCC 10500]EED13080.1 SNARE complex subunit (Syn8), putative [Talaromyces stipitatus ATCC 10500]